jgi:DNA-directed RNA polymerase subunit RPC12/RpoP
MNGDPEPEIRVRYPCATCGGSGRVAIEDRAERRFAGGPAKRCPVCGANAEPGAISAEWVPLSRLREMLG